jgi:exopolysaccharide biosynthesis polyprenyl glycosylphosphotransferase
MNDFSSEAVIDGQGIAAISAPAHEFETHKATPRREPVRQPFRRKLLIVLGDFALVTTISLIIGLPRHIPVASILFLVVTFPVAFYVAGLYERRVEGDWAMFLARLTVACITVVMMVGPVSYLVRSILLPRGFVAMQMLLVLAAFPWYRAVMDGVLRYTNVPVKIAVLGAGKAGTALIEALEKTDDYVLCGVYDDNPAMRGTKILNTRVSGTSQHLLKATADRRPDVVAVAVTNDKSPELMHALLEFRRQGVRITDMVTPYEQIMGRLPVQHLSDTWIAFWSNFSAAERDFQHKLKRATDIVGSIALLCVSSIPLLIAALLIKLTSRGAVFYRQERVGRDGRSFQILKLRTMSEDAEKSGPQWASLNDDRITGVGRYLRRLRLDEFPQLINVLRGDMSLVGPRPERPEFVHVLEKSIPHYVLRHMVKPGITGWAQVSYPYGASIFDSRMKLEYDLFYIRHMGPIFDLRILLRTVHALLFGGAR